MGFLFRFDTAEIGTQDRSYLWRRLLEGNHAFRQACEEQGLLQAVPSQVPQEARGQDRLLRPQAPGGSGQEQIQHPEVPHGRPLLQQGRLLPDSVCPPDACSRNSTLTLSTRVTRR